MTSPEMSKVTNTTNGASHQTSATIQKNIVLNYTRPFRIPSLSGLEELSGQHRIEQSRFILKCGQNNFSNLYALAQANLVQQTQHDILKMFSPDNFPMKDKSSRNEEETKKTNKDEQHICEMPGCGRLFASAGYLKNHQLMHEKEKSLECHYEGCGRKFSWPAHLKYHLLTHQKTRNYKCSVEDCDKTFITGQQLKVHSRTHTGEKPFKCDQCEKAFTTAGNLKNHIRIHTGDRPYECPEPNCFLKFAEYSSLKKHSIKHSGEKPFKCSICNRKFTQSGSMRVHMKKHALKQTETSINKETEVVMVDSNIFNNIDFQIVCSSTPETEQIVTTEQHITVPVSNEMLLVKDSSMIEDNSTSVVVLPLPQIPVTMGTGFIQTLEQEEIDHKNELMNNVIHHEESICTISEEQNRCIR